LRQIVVRFAAKRAAFCGKTRSILRQNAGLLCRKMRGYFAAKRKPIRVE
jgi:hypothetical protein